MAEFTPAERLSQCWNQGADAYFMSLRLASCPYETGTDEHKHWAIGFCQTRAYMKKDIAA